MTRLLGAGLALALMSGVAMAQGETPAAPEEGGGAPAVTEETTPQGGPDDSSDWTNRSDWRADGLRDRRERWARYHDDRRWMERRGPGHRRMTMHHGWKHPRMDGSETGAARFRFDRGDRGGSIDITCAAEDTTQECVDAIMPLIETMMDARSSRYDR